MIFFEKELYKCGKTQRIVTVNETYTIVYGIEGYGYVKKIDGMIYPFFIGYDKQVYFDDFTYYINNVERLPEYIINKVRKGVEK